MRSSPVGGLYSVTMTHPTETRRGPEPPDISEKGGMKDGQPQRSDERLFMQLLAFGGCAGRRAAGRRAGARRDAGVLYEDVNDPRGVGAADVQRRPRLLRRSRAAAA